MSSKQVDRNNSIIALYAAGLRICDVAWLLGMTPSRVGQIVRAPERDRAKRLKRANYKQGREARMAAVLSAIGGRHGTV